LSGGTESRIPICFLGEHDRNNFPLEASYPSGKAGPGVALRD
jgi:hypothetical protein